jgi:hypothetical protein
VIAALAIIGCAAPSPTPTPTPTAGSDLPTLALPEGISGIPGPGEVAFSVAAHTPAGGVPVGADQTYTLGHCGLFSPIDIDGSLWDPIAGESAAGGPLTEVHVGELINSTTVVLVLVDAQTMLFATPAGARIVLERHDGRRLYLGCD